MPYEQSYIPVLKYNSLTRFYDVVLEKLLRENAWKSYLLDNFANKAPQQMLDIGCGTGTLTLMIKQKFPSAKVIGLDGDPKVLAIAEKKINIHGTEIKLQKGYSYDLPFPDNFFDAVSSSLMLHHLTKENKHRTFKEVLRVLKPGGELNIADWGKPSNIGFRVLFYPVQLLDGFTTTRDNVKGLLPAYLKDAGFDKVQELKKFNTVMGSISIYRALKSL